MRALVAESESDAPLGNLTFHPRQLQRIWAGVRLASRASRAAPPPQQPQPPPPPPPPAVEVAAGVAGEAACVGETPPSDGAEGQEDAQEGVLEERGEGV